MGAAAETVRGWFTLADTNHDGILSGAEAVGFFQRSGLPKGTLAQIWEMTAGSSPSLSLPQFWTAIQLVALAQREGGQLSAGHTAAVRNGSVTLPLPRMTGLEAAGPAQPQQQPHVQAVNLASSTLEVGGMLTGQEYKRTSSLSGSQRSSASQPPSPGGGWPPMTPTDYQRYLQSWQALDSDRDGWVSGQDCFPVFTQSGLSRDILKRVWDVVAGQRGALTAADFFKAMYLIECCRKGIPLPSSLPPEPFPPTLPVGVAAPDNAPISRMSSFDSHSRRVSQDSIGGGNYALPPGREYEAPRVKRSSVEVPEIPVLEELQQPPADPSTDIPSAYRTPVLEEAKLKCLPTDQRERLLNDLNDAEETSAKLEKLERDVSHASTRISFYRDKLSKLTIVKSRTDTVLMQAQEKVKKHQTEADATTLRYNGAMKTMQTEHGEGMALMARGAAAVQRRKASHARLQELQAEMQALSSALPQNPHKDPVVEAMEAQVAKMQAEVAAIEVRGMSYVKQIDLMRAKMTALQNMQHAPQTAAAVAESTQHIRNLRQRTSAPGASDGEKAGAVEALSKLHSILSVHASAAGLPVPQLATPTTPDEAKQIWMEKDPSGGAWADFKDAGVKEVDAVPDISDNGLAWDAVANSSVEWASGISDLTSDFPGAAESAGNGTIVDDGAAPAPAFSSGFDTEASFPAASPSTQQPPQPPQGSAPLSAPQSAPAAAPAGFDTSFEEPAADFGGVMPSADAGFASFGDDTDTPSDPSRSVFKTISNDFSPPPAVSSHDLGATNTMFYSVPESKSAEDGFGDGAWGFGDNAFGSSPAASAAEPEAFPAGGSAAADVSTASAAVDWSPFGEDSGWGDASGAGSDFANASGTSSAKAGEPGFVAF